MTSRSQTAAPAVDAPRALAPTCCSRPMSTISVTDAATELSLLSCSACSRHAWLQNGVLLDRDGMLAAVRQRLAEAPRPKGGRPKGSGRKAAPAVPSPRSGADVTDVDRSREMRSMLSGFQVHGQ